LIAASQLTPPTNNQKPSPSRPKPQNPTQHPHSCSHVGHPLTLVEKERKGKEEEKVKEKKRRKEKKKLSTKSISIKHKTSSQQHNKM